jgi:hypothetical protein
MTGAAQHWYFMLERDASVVTWPHFKAPSRSICDPRSAPHLSVPPTTPPRPPLLVRPHPETRPAPPPPPQPSHGTPLARGSRDAVTAPRSLHLFPPLSPSPLLSPLDPIGAETRAGQSEEATRPMELLKDMFVRICNSCISSDVI